MSISRKNSFVIILLTILLVLSSITTYAVSDQEKDYARETLKYFKKEFGFAEIDSHKKDRLDSILSNLEAETVKDDSDLDFKYYVLDAPAINAFNIGDGYILIFKGFLNLLERDSQIASVFAHEMGHGINDDIQENIDMYNTLNTVAILFEVFGDTKIGDDFGEKMILDLMLKGFSRSQEKDADKYAVHLLYRTDYDLQGMVEMFEILQDNSDKTFDIKLFELFSNHPHLSTRIDYTEDLIRKLSKKGKKEVDNNRNKSFVFRDDFSSPDSGWSIDEDSDYKDGVYEIKADRENSIYWSFAPIRDTGNYYTVEADLNLTRFAGGYGFIFNYLDNDNYYIFSVNSITNKYRLLRKVNDNWEIVIGWTRTEDIKDRVNHLRINRTGSRVRLYANGVFLQEAQVKAYDKKTKIGIAAVSDNMVPVYVHYDNFLFRELPRDKDKQQQTESKIVYSDKFNTDSGWLTDDIRYYQQGAYKIKAVRENWLYWSEVPIGKIDSEYVVRAEMTTESTGDYGFVFNFLHNDDYYIYKVNPASGMYCVLRNYNGDWKTVIDWQDSRYIREHNNTLKLIRVGKDVRFYVNGEYLNKAEIKEHTSKTEIALLAGSYRDVPAIISFDNLVIK